MCRGAVHVPSDITEPAQRKDAVAIPTGYIPNMRLSRYGLAGGAVLLVCGVTGFVVGWSSFAEGGLENYYRSGLLGLVGGLLLGIAVIVTAKAIMGRRQRSAQQ